jgi:hypothetical protein
MALDAQNNLYVAFVTPQPDIARVFKFAPGSTQGTDLNLQVPPNRTLLGMSLGKHGQLYIASPNEPGIYEFHLPKTALYRTIGSSTLTAPSAVALNAFKSHLWATDLCCGGMWHVFGFKVPGGLATDELDIRPEALGLSGIAAYPPPSQSTVPTQIGRRGRGTI